jgi:hypothetical protein
MALIRQNPVATYYAIAFAISWGLLFYFVGCLQGFPATPDAAENHLMAVVLATVAGPSIAGCAMTFLVYGDTRDLRERLFKWQRWYPFIGLFAPVTVVTILGALCLLVSSEHYLPAIVSADKKMALVLTGVGYGVIAGFFEELGWSGFVVPETRKQGYGIVATGLMVGLMWGLWHFLVAVWGSGTEDGSFSFDLFIPWIPWNLLVLPCYRVLMVLLYERTESIPSMAILHGTLTASLPLMLMPPATGYALSAFYTIFAAVLGIAIVILVNGKYRERKKTD